MSKRVILKHRKYALLTATGALLLAGLLRPVPVQSATFVVDRFDDDASATACTVAANDCSLRGAIITANANGVDDEITLPAGTYTLTIPGTNESGSLDGNLDIASNITFQGAGMTTTIIAGNGAVTGENVLRIFAGSTVAINDLTIEGGQGSSGGGGIYNGGDLALTNVQLRNNTDTSNGGGVFHLNGDLIISGSMFSNNVSSGNGGAISINAGSVTVSSTTFSENQAGSGFAGGAIKQNDGTLTIDSSSTFEKNSAYSGGALSADATVTIGSSTIAENQASMFGGGIQVGLTSNVTLTGTLVSSNVTTDSGSDGGGLYVEGALSMTGGQVYANDTQENGAGIYVGNGASIDLEGVTVQANRGLGDPSNGGGIYSFLGVVTLDDTIVDANLVSGPAASFSSGGGIYSAGILTITDSQINNNSALYLGGGLYADSDSTLTMTNGTLRGNLATGSSSRGGGLSIGSGVLATLKQVEISGNFSTDSAGGLHSQGILTLENSTISSNVASFAGGMISAGADNVSYSTIYDNLVISGSLTGGLAAYNSLTLEGTIVAGNDNNQCLNSGGSSILTGGHNISGDASCGFTGVGDLQNTDPLLGPLVENGAGTRSHQPLTGSPAIDAGDNADCPLIDQRGFTRPVDGDVDGSAICDIGAVEVQLKLFLPLIAR